jgi:DNA-binding transcriptional MocR family regulator
MICSLFLKNKENVVFIEDLTYFLALGIFNDCPNTRVVAMPMDQNGLIVDDAFELQVILQRPKILYTIPTFHNPTGTICS